MSDDERAIQDIVGRRDEFFGCLYHLDAMEDPCHPNYPYRLRATVGPRNMIHSWATDVDDPNEQPRGGRVGKQRIEDAGELGSKRMETVDDEILSNAMVFIDKAREWIREQLGKEGISIPLPTGN